MTLPVYLDNHSTTRVDDRVLAAMVPFFTEHYGNAASRQHKFGWTAEAAVNRSRKQIATLLHCAPEELLFTSGATESINLALKGLAEAHAGTKHHIVTAATEHRAVLDSCQRLKEVGFEVSVLPVDGAGRVDPDDVGRAIRPDTLCVSIMAANNEIGTIAPLEAVAEVCRTRGVVFHTDATQAVPSINVNLETSHIDLLSLSGHKCYGPKGVGVLYVRKGIALEAQIDGGGHQSGLRSGTLDVPGIVGIGQAASLLSSSMTDDSRRVAALRDEYWSLLSSTLDGLEQRGDLSRRLPGNLNMTFRGVSADRLMMEAKDVCFSTGAACSSGLPGPSHVLKAIGVSDADAACTVRFGLGRFTTAEEIHFAAETIIRVVRGLRARAGAAA
jgi:cysteine desulfurase